MQETLGARRTDRNFVTWLRRFGEEALQDTAAHRSLAERIARFSEIEDGELASIAQEFNERLHGAGAGLFING